MKTIETPTYDWWIEPLDDITNQVIAEELPSSSTEEILIENFRRRRAWPCSYELIAKLKKAARTSRINLRYYVYNRRGNSQIRRVPIFEPAK